VFFIEALVAGAASGVYNSPQQAAVADIIGKARGGTAIAAFQMMSDFGSIVGSFGVGLLAHHLSYGWAFGISGAILVVASIGWMFAPETRDQSPLEHTPVRALGPEAAGELP
jgi:MFS family permease